jgi:hypothetical protein
MSSNERIALSQIRRSPSAANELIRQFVPKRHLIEVLKVVAHSVQVAHQASPSNWGLRLNRNSVMLKVGFVEVLQFGKGWFHELALGGLVPEKLRTNRRLNFNDPPYANAPGCETCDMALAEASEAYLALLPAHEAAIHIAARSRRHISTTKDHSPGLIVFLAEELGIRLPQPAYLDNPLENAPLIPEEIPADEEFEEGAVTQVLVNRYERDPAARERCIEHYGTNCFVCGLALADQYGTEVEGLIHVHHLTPIASVGGRSSVDPIRDLRPVCPNCHAVIHSTRPPRTIEQVKEMMRKNRDAQQDATADVPDAARGFRDAAELDTRFPVWEPRVASDQVGGE